MGRYLKISQPNGNNSVAETIRLAVLLDKHKIEYIPRVVLGGPDNSIARNFEGSLDPAGNRLIKFTKLFVEDPSDETCTFLALLLGNRFLIDEVDNLFNTKDFTQDQANLWLNAYFYIRSAREGR